MTKLKVGVIALVDSVYSFGQCLVKVTAVPSKYGNPDAFDGVLVDCDPCYDPYPEGAVEDSDCHEWTFKNERLLAVVEK